MGSSSQKIPLELLHQILSTVTTTSIHSIGTCRGSPWDIGVFSTLSRVSPLFDDIVCELARKIFGLVGRDGRNIINDTEKLMNEFHQLNKTDSWPEVSKNYPEQYPSHIFAAYSFLACAIDLRESLTDSSVSAFLTTQNTVKEALERVNSWAIEIPEIASALSMRSGQELTLLAEATNLVQACMRAESLLDELPNHSNDSPNSPSSIREEEVRCTELETLLCRMEKVATKYNYECLSVGSQQSKAVQLPGVAQALHKIFCISSNKSIFASPIKELLLRWVNDSRNLGSFLEDFGFGYPISLSFIY